jgi:hypothetical protein
MHPRVKIESTTGITARDVKITLEDGTEITGVRGAVIWLEANEVNRVSLDIHLPAVEIEAEVPSVELTCPICQESVTHACDPNGDLVKEARRTFDNPSGG